MDIEKALKRAGLHFKRCTIYNIDFSGRTGRGLLVQHDYSGPCPSKESMAAYELTRSIAARAGKKSEQRGHYVSTLIYL